MVLEWESQALRDHLFDAEQILNTQDQDISCLNGMVHSKQYEHNQLAWRALEREQKLKQLIIGHFFENSDYILAISVTRSATLGSAMTCKIFELEDANECRDVALRNKQNSMVGACSCPVMQEN
jgi:hypothetical protein